MENQIAASDSLFENWKRQAIDDPTLNKLFSKNVNIQDFILDLVRNSEMTEISEKFSKMNQVK